MEDKTPALEFVDNPHAPDVFATDAAGFINLAGTVVITMQSLRSDYSTNPGTVRGVVVGRLVMPAEGAHRLAIGLFDFLKNQGFEFPVAGASASVQ